MRYHFEIFIFLNSDSQSNNTRQRSINIHERKEDLAKQLTVAMKFNEQLASDLEAKKDAMGTVTKVLLQCIMENYSVVYILQ